MSRARELPPPPLQNSGQLQNSGAHRSTLGRSPVITIALNTATEAMRQPIHAILLLLGIGLQGLNPLVAAFTLGDDDQLLLELGLSTIFLLGMFLASFTAALALGDEIRRQTVLTVLSKPISRTSLLLGKFLGIALALGSAWWVWSFALLLSVRHQVIMTVRDGADAPVITFACAGLGLAMGLSFWSNWRHGSSFPSRISRHLVWIAPLATVCVFSFNKEWQLQSPLSDLDGNVLGALVLLYEAMLILGAVALAASTRLGTMATLAVTSAVFVVGMVGGAIAGGASWRFLLPNLQYLWVSDGLIRGADLTWGAGIASSVWALSYTIALVALAAALFRTRDVS